MRTFSATLLLVALSGCVAPVALDRAVLEYDRAVHGIESKLLLLNIARASAAMPLHFTTVSGIAATFEFRVRSGITGEVAEGPAPAVLGASFSAEAAESPTISILPVQGEEFTRRMLTPLDERTFAFLVHQGVDASLLLRLTGRAIALESDGGRRPFYRNDPQHEDEYREFRRRVLHLAALKEAGVLDVGELSYRARVLLPARADALGVPELAALLEKGFRLEREAGEDFLERSITGRLLVANYDPRELDDEERSALQRRAEAYPRNFVLVDVRPGHPGGEYPFQGWIKLRSFHAVLEFIGAGLNAAPEHDVAPAPETPAPAENPARTLEIRVDNAAGEEPLAVRFEGRRYSLAPGLWNRRGFQILHQLFQMTVSDMRASELPIAIAK